MPTSCMTCKRSRLTDIANAQIPLNFRKVIKLKITLAQCCQDWVGHILFTIQRYLVLFPSPKLLRGFLISVYKVYKTFLLNKSMYQLLFKNADMCFYMHGYNMLYAFKTHLMINKPDSFCVKYFSLRNVSG